MEITVRPGWRRYSPRLFRSFDDPDGPLWSVYDRQLRADCALPDPDGTPRPLLFTTPEQADRWLEGCYRAWGRIPLVE
ncbi:hypothetical protein [Streptantibioticus cattleyicolor]|uniref:Uncharacterized protein n=1 Tax=Streptantibioticus cattleyicolor (strain ATCC 35852 / DSM 46488 / JCM 4925 / NBRC 14057 / NRRL 8057) TaxID=1003195 RepID=F8JLP6_STREN|nr:hypothetical protein [Streptantibioticus cattleyicolor]AEW99525.1 hypothetical protein SCATT_p13320 [Streptantibioticus cattleyicolor NRRL 8057 = DSM 46488]CCB71436.1 protein of unknown function [Streptantibioticus cattleyicolor NRRL 8057 = DSM 46488]